MNRFVTNYALLGGNSKIARFVITIQRYTTARPVKISKKRGETAQQKHFVDFRRVLVTGGDGGDGMVSFLSLPQTEWAGPDGGNGGNGGHIIFEATSTVKSLGHLPSILRAQPGEGGRNKHCHGANTKHTIIKQKHFVDFRRVLVTGGDGGDGMVSFLSLPQTEWAGPDGGNGGNGGHIIFEATSTVKSLGHLPSILRAQPGEGGRNKHCHGANTKHTIIKVPLGTIVGDESGKCISSLEKLGDYCIGAHGGGGGKGNHFFLTNENRAPTQHELGAKGEKCYVHLELRVMAHAGLVGFPNVGKSTLLRAISRARPKVAAYPFTTLNPHVGMVQYDDFEQLAVADIPGLVKGAHKNLGLGFSFLRHIQRCVCLLYVIDLSDDSYLTQLGDLKYELEQYEPGLSNRPHAIVGNKIDLESSSENLTALQKRVDLPVIAVSARNGTNISDLLLNLREMYDKNLTTTNVQDDTT